MRQEDGHQIYITCESPGSRLGVAQASAIVCGEVRSDCLMFDIEALGEI
jgi:hypothetical protein